MQSVTASLRYIAPPDQPVVYNTSTAGANAQLDINVPFDDRRVDIFNARELAPAPSLDREGFSLVHHNTAIDDFYALADRLADYEEELRQLVLAATGGKQLMVFDHTHRSDSAQIRGQQQTREATALIHNDYTESSAHKRLGEILGAEVLDEYKDKRFMIVNLWRSINGTVMRSPLACCDAQTVVEDNVIAAERRTADRIGELELVTYRADQRWYFYPQLRFDEALLIKTYDSQPGGAAKRAIHTAFEDATAPLNAPPRESMESRMLVLF